MIKCPFCKTVHVDNTLFCSECGYYLLQDEKRETDQIDEVGWMGNSTHNKPGNASLIQPGPKPRAIRLKIGANKREVEMPLGRIINIGRVDPASNTFPEIDLSVDGTPANSVSRRHARILKQDDTVVVEDGGSINGTFVNGKKLDPYLPEVLNDGDTLQLGTLLIEVKILKQ